MQNTDIAKTETIETSEEIRETFSVRKSHLWYAFVSDIIPNATKIGDTTRGIPTRVGEWRRVFPDARIIGTGDLEVIPGTFVRDHALHHGCESLGYHELEADEFTDGIKHTTEAYSVRPDKALAAIDEVIEDIVMSHDDPQSPYTYYSVEDDTKEVGVSHYKRDDFDWDLRPMQEEAVDNIENAVALGIDTMLLDASVRFGKCFTTLAAAKRLGYTKILVTSGKADVEGEWQKAVEQPGQFMGWDFVSPEMLRVSDKILTNVIWDADVTVCFMTLQDSYNAEDKRRYDQVFDTKWDMLVVDETHFGARAEEFSKAIDRVMRRTTLHLSGSPFRILATDEFSDDQIVACKTRSDMVAERDAWDETNADAIAAGELSIWQNPYFGIPTPVTFALRANAETLAKIGVLKEDGITIDLAELLATDHDAENPAFKHEESVRELLKMVDGEDDTLGFLNYDIAGENDLFRHMVMCLPEKDSCDAMADLIKEMSKDGELDRLGEYEVINVAGNHAPKRYKDVQQVVRDVAKTAAEGKRTISLTVYRMLTGVTVPEWDTMLMLSGMGSPESYEQATGRLMSPFVQTVVNEKDADDKLKVNRKPYVVVVDFDPTRVFVMAEQRSIAQRLTGKDIDEAVEHEMRYAPIITANEDGFKCVTPTDLRREISRYATNGITEEVEKIPVDSGMFSDGDFMGAIQGFDGNEKARRRDIEVDPFEEDGAELDIDLPDADGDVDENPADEEAGNDDGAGVIDPQEAKREADDARKVFEAKVRDFYFRSVAFAAAWQKGQVKTLDDIRIRAKATKTGRTIASNLGILDDIDVLCSAVSRFKNVRLQLDNAIYNISTLVNDPELTGMEKAEILMQRFGRLSSSEVATPLWVARKMVGAIPETAFEKDTPRFLDLASKVGEMAYALVERCGRIEVETGRKLTPEIRSVTTSPIAYVLCVAVYRLLGLDYRQVAKFTSYDLLGKDIKTMAKTLRQDKDFYQIDLFDMLGENAGEQTDEVEEQPVDEENNNGKTADEKPLISYDAIVSNPPYQQNIGKQKKNYAVPVYQEFVALSKAVTPSYISIIMPARWFAGGRGLNEFRTEMLSDTSIRALYDWPNSYDCFPGAVEIQGGVCFILWDRDNQGDCNVTTYSPIASSDSMSRPLLEANCETFIRYNEAVSIVRKVQAFHEPSFMSLVSPQTPFGVITSYKGTRTQEHSTDLPMYVSGNEKEFKGACRWCPADRVTKGHNMIAWHKVYIGKAYGGGMKFPHAVISKPFYGAPNTICNQSYLCIGPFANQQECQNVISYYATKFVRFLILQKKNAQDAMRNVYQFVPQQDWSKPWTDAELYQKYGLTEDEIQFIESMIRPLAL